MTTQTDRELADEWVNNRHWSFGSPVLGMGDRMAAHLRAHADAADKVREGLTDEQLLNAVFSKGGVSFSHPEDGETYTFDREDLVAGCRAIAAHYAPVVAENERLRAQLATTERETDRLRSLIGDMLTTSATAAQMMVSLFEDSRPPVSSLGKKEGG